MLFRRLAVFVGGWTLEAAEQVCADTDLPAHTVLDLLTSLIDKSFVETIGSAEAHGSSRFRLLNPVKQFATEKLLGEEPLGNDSVAARHRLYYRDLAERADDELWTLDPANRARLEAEAPNMRAALEHGCEYHPTTHCASRQRWVRTGASRGSTRKARTPCRPPWPTRPPRPTTRGRGRWRCTRS